VHRRMSKRMPCLYQRGRICGCLLHLPMVTKLEVRNEAANDNQSSYRRVLNSPYLDPLQLAPRPRRRRRRRLHVGGAGEVHE